MRYVLISLAQTAGVILLAVSGVLIGRRFWRVKSRAWIVAYALPLLVVAAIGIPRRHPQAELVPPFKWIMSGRTEFAVIAIACTMLLTTPLSRLPQRRNRRAVVVLMILVTGYFSVLPFLFPVFEYSRLADVDTMLDVDGVCIQSTRFNCGPAAAVTVLRRLGVHAEEGQLALRAHTSRFTGTPTDCLRNAIRREYGVPCRIVYCRDVGELKDKTPFAAIVKFSFMIDHYVAVLSVTETDVTIGDPLAGLITCTPEEFEKEWRGCAIVIEKSEQIEGK
ncbi:MAG: cysteine peptidase family C39 domain-containing protein, partial [Planctomycetota bacterium]